MKKCLNTMAAVLISMTCLLPSSLTVYGEDGAPNASPEPSAPADAVADDGTAENAGAGEERKAGISDSDEASKLDSTEKEDNADESSDSALTASPSPGSSQKDEKADSSTESPDPAPKKAILKALAVSSASGAFTLTLQNDDGTISKKNNTAAGTLSSDQKTLTITDGLKPDSDELDTLNQYEVSHDSTDAYIFDGWFTDDGIMLYRPYGKNANDGTYWNLDKYVGGKDLTLHAQWVKASVLHYDGNGGTTDYPMPVYTFDPAKPFSLTSNTYVKDGYVFAGWNTAANGTGTAYQEDQNVSLSGNTTLYAQWVPQKQTIDQAANGGAFTIVNNTLKNYQYKITEKNYFPHYVSSVGNGKVYDLSDLQDGLTVTNTRVAVVTFDKNADDASGDGVLQQAPLNQPTVLNDNPYTRDGYMFAGWNTKPDGTGDAYDPKQLHSFGDDITLYAQWVPLKQSEKITYDTNKTDSTWTKVSSGSLVVPSDSDTYSAKFYESLQLRYSSDAAKWNPKTDNDLTGDNKDQLTITNDKKFPVYFHGNGADNDADGMPVPQYFARNETAALIANLFTKKGYVFIGWKIGNEKDGKIVYENADPYTVDYGNMASFTENTHSDQGINLYAQWAPLKTLQDGSEGAGTYNITLSKSNEASDDKNTWSRSVDLPTDTAENSYDVTKIYENDPDYYESSNDSSNPAEIKDDEVTIINKNITSSLTIENHVTGNLGSRDKPFKFTVKMTKGADHPITGDKLAVLINGKRQNLSFDDKGQIELSLQSGDKAVITPLYNGTSYSITESDYKQDGYELTDKSTSGVLSSDTTAIFTNNRAAGIPTGLFDIFRKLWWIVPIAAVAMAIGIYIKHRSMAGKHC
ncbi:InlB B-repeat-containing protein [Stecheria sp. CLA-KB-P133]|uniref:InlB B-repeat-containing protein n=1 Tax=Grylomicrobium aquisgranensis TaxID=2926318 RepID=A0AB35U382_9FIRM|nr:InlB B-repeat-containing protein [Stecheria sp. CLA-KB-P133]